MLTLSPSNFYPVWDSDIRLMIDQTVRHTMRQDAGGYNPTLGYTHTIPPMGAPPARFSFGLAEMFERRFDFGDGQSESWLVPTPDGFSRRVSFFRDVFDAMVEAAKQSVEEFRRVVREANYHPNPDVVIGHESNAIYSWTWDDFTRAVDVFYRSLTWELQCHALESLCRAEGWLYEPHGDYVDIRIREGALAFVSVSRQGFVAAATGFHTQTGAGPVAGSNELPELSAVVVPRAQAAIAAFEGSSQRQTV